jgi:hypothetical protein
MTSSLRPSPSNEADADVAELWDTARTPRPRSRPMAPHGAWHRGTGEPRRLPGVAKSAIETGDFPMKNGDFPWFPIVYVSLPMYQKVKAGLSGTYWHTWHWLFESIWVKDCVPKLFFVRQMIRRGGLNLIWPTNNDNIEDSTKEHMDKIWVRMAWWFSLPTWTHECPQNANCVILWFMGKPFLSW